MTPRPTWLGRSVAGPPIRFLGAVCGGWVAVRALMLWPDLATPGSPAFAASGGPHAAAPPANLEPLRSPQATRTGLDPVVQPAASRAGNLVHGAPLAASATAPGSADRPADHLWSLVLDDGGPAPVLATAFGPRAGFSSLPSLTPGAPRPSLPSAAFRHDLRMEAALYLRSGGFGRPLEPSLGGSQAIVTARLPVTRRVAASARLTGALGAGGPSQVETALGVAVRPRDGPIELVAERRVALSSDGRNAFQLRAVGGGSVEAGEWRLDAYGQAGVVGAGARDLFADGQARVSRSVAGPLRAGAVVVGAAQPGARRLDAGPQLRLDVATGGLPVSLLADYRLRLAGNAAPASGPSLTLAASF